MTIMLRARGKKGAMGTDSAPITCARLARSASLALPYLTPACGGRWNTCAEHETKSSAASHFHVRSPVAGLSSPVASPTLAINLVARYHARLKL
jgi:hypothetical protein